MSPQITFPSEIQLKSAGDQPKPADIFFNPTFSPTFSPTLPALDPTPIEVKVSAPSVENHVHMPEQFFQHPISITNVYPWKPLAIICFLNSGFFASLIYLINWLNLR
jgi:hypothetical protein